MDKSICLGKLFPFTTIPRGGIITCKLLWYPMYTKPFLCLSYYFTSMCTNYPFFLSQNILRNNLHKLTIYVQDTQISLWQHVPMDLLVLRLVVMVLLLAYF